MALFTDANIVTLDDLLEFETALVQVASTHGINVETKVKLATDAIGERLMVWLLGVGASDPQWPKRRILGLSTIVVTQPLKQWLCYETLSRFFAEAYNVQLNTRFQGKWTEYQQASRVAAEMTFASDLGMVYNPLPRPAMPLMAIETGTLDPQALFVQTTWVDQNGAESALSPVNGTILDSAATIVVGMSEGALGAPETAAGWNVYASTTSDELTRQNSAPLSIGSTWELPATGLIDGAGAGDGQHPDSYIRLSKQIRRG